MIFTFDISNVVMAEIKLTEVFTLAGARVFSSDAAVSFEMLILMAQSTDLWPVILGRLTLTANHLDYSLCRRAVHTTAALGALAAFWVSWIRRRRVLHLKLRRFHRDNIFHLVLHMKSVVRCPRRAEIVRSPYTLFLRWSFATHVMTSSCSRLELYQIVFLLNFEGSRSYRWNNQVYIVRLAWRISKWTIPAAAQDVKWLRLQRCHLVWPWLK
jgi:hypothetical protein